MFTNSMTAAVYRVKHSSEESVKRHKQQLHELLSWILHNILPESLTKIPERNKRKRVKEGGRC